MLQERSNKWVSWVVREMGVGLGKQSGAELGGSTYTAPDWRFTVSCYEENRGTGAFQPPGTLNIAGTKADGRLIPHIPRTSQTKKHVINCHPAWNCGFCNSFLHN